MYEMAFKTYLREYLCISEENIPREVRKFNHCMQLHCSRPEEDGQTEEPAE